MEEGTPIPPKETSPPLAPVATAPVVSWVKVVQQKTGLTKYDLKVAVSDGVSSVVVPEEVFEDPSPLWEDFLIGKFLDSAPHVAKVHSIVNKIWAMGDKSQMIDVHVVNSTTMKFRIVNPITRNRIIRRGMWNLAEVPVIMSKWTPFIADNSPEITSVPLWVHLKNVPIDMYSWKGLSFVTSAVGEPVRLHPDTAQCLDFQTAKVFVKADFSKDLPKSINFNIKGKDTLVEFSYPWLPPRCTICEKWGHLHTVCVANKKVVGVEVSLPLVTEKSPEKVKEHQLIIAETEQRLVSGVEMEDVGIQGEGDKEIEWSEVSPKKGGRSPTMKKQELQFGEVSILQHSQFSVLSDLDGEENTEKNEESVECIEENIEQTLEIVQNISAEVIREELKTNDADQPENDDQLTSDVVLPVRPTRPRASKANHKFVTDQSTQKAKDVSKRVPRRNN